MVLVGRDKGEVRIRTAVNLPREETGKTAGHRDPERRAASLTAELTNLLGGAAADLLIGAMPRPETEIVETTATEDAESILWRENARTADHEVTDRLDDATHSRTAAVRNESTACETSS